MVSISLGVCIFSVVARNAVGSARRESQAADSGHPTKRGARASSYYGLLAALILIVGILAIALDISGWQYWLFVVEVAIASLFVAFWIVQTTELWHAGLRESLPNLVQ